MQLTDLTRSTYARFAALLTAAFLAAYLIAGWVAFQSINSDLDGRVLQAAELTIERLEDVFEAGGRDALTDAVDLRARADDPEDQFYWLGQSDGTRLAGATLQSPLSLIDGDMEGADLGFDEDDSYRLAVRQFGDLKLVIGRSYEETNEIRNAVLTAFGLATAISLLIAAAIAAVLARIGQQRVEQIAGTLHKVADGKMSARVPETGSRDDLGRLGGQINDALGQLEDTVEGIRQVSADIAHDLRTPINRLGITLEQMETNLANNPKLEVQLDAARAQVTQITATFDALLRIAQIEAGARKARFGAVPLTEIAVSLHETYLAVAEDAGQSLTLLQPSGEMTLVLGDKELLTQLFANLIENAIRHCPSGAAIRMEIGTGLQGVWFSVSDNGPGIDDEERERVLKRFYRLDKSRSTTGSGLGLAMVKAISDLHGADLTLSDNAPGLKVRVRFEPLSKAMRHEP